MTKVKVGDINIYYEIHGEGEPLVMIQGLSTNVDWLFKGIPVLSQEYKVIAFDNRGAGRSDAPDIPYTMEMMADDLAGLLDAIGIDATHIQGVSMGGGIAQHFALRYPERVISLILMCTGVGRPYGIPTTDPEIIDYFQHPKELPLKESMMESLPLFISQEYIDSNPEFIQELVAKMIEHPATPQGQMRQNQAVMNHDTYDRLPEIKAPTLVIHGSADRVSPVENARILASRIPGAELVIMDKMGHLFMYEAFDETNRIILDFLKRNRRS